MNLERFEHELVKIKNKVAPDFKGTPFGGKCNDHCIVHQIVHDMGYCGLPWHSTFHPFYDWKRNRKLMHAVQVAVDMNNEGRTWHDIVDTIVPQTVEHEHVLEVSF